MRIARGRVMAAARQSRYRPRAVDDLFEDTPDTHATASRFGCRLPCDDLNLAQALTREEYLAATEGDPK
jgi:hypothetical protein